MDCTNQINQNFALHTHLLPSLTAGMEVFKRPQLIFADSGLSCDTFNIIYVLTGDGLQLEELREAVAHYRQKENAFCLWINQHNLTPSVLGYLGELGLSEAGGEPGMCLDLGTYEPKTPEGAIRRVQTLEELQAFAEVTSLNWSPPDVHVLTYYKRVAPSLLSGSGGIELYCYYLEGRAVSVLELFPSDAVTAGLYNLSTLASFRGRGIGTAMMRFALNRLKELGFERAVLQASEDGVDIYKRLGFKELTRFYEFK